MRQTWRWFGPEDLVSIEAMLQAGVEGVVSALHAVPNGEVWSPRDIAQRQQEIAHKSDGTASGLKWEVVESLPVSELIKKQDGDWRDHIEHYKESLTNLHAAGLRVVCYNFMPILDWTRTNLRWQLPHGGSCMRFDLIDFALFDLYLLKRSAALLDYDAAIIELAEERFNNTDTQFHKALTSAIVCGLPGANQNLDLHAVRQLLEQYSDVTAERLRNHHHDFLELVAPHAQQHGMLLCCHPDDPPFNLLGLPRVMSTEADYQQMLDAVDLQSNGITLCSGSLGVRSDNDLPGMMSRLGSRVHFAHLRNVRREKPVWPASSGKGVGVAGSFHEAEHLAGDTDMVLLIAEILNEEARRKEQGRADWQIPMRPDHGQDILDDLNRRAQPGYPSIGRLKGLAELRGVSEALSHSSVVRGSPHSVAT